MVKFEKVFAIRRIEFNMFCDNVYKLTGKAQKSNRKISQKIGRCSSERSKLRRLIQEKKLQLISWSVTAQMGNNLWSANIHCC